MAAPSTGVSARCLTFGSGRDDWGRAHRARARGARVSARRLATFSAMRTPFVHDWARGSSAARRTISRMSRRRERLTCRQDEAFRSESGDFAEAFLGAQFVRFGESSCSSPNSSVAGEVAR